MEKRKPHYSLEKMKALVRDGQYRVTRTALATAFRDFGFMESGYLAQVVLHLRPGDFYKSMTAIRDNALWQDVYHGSALGIPCYIKLQIVSETTLIISFKKQAED